MSKISTGTSISLIPLRLLDDSAILPQSTVGSPQLTDRPGESGPDQSQTNPTGTPNRQNISLQLFPLNTKDITQFPITNSRGNTILMDLSDAPVEIKSISKRSIRIANRARNP